MGWVTGFPKLGNAAPATSDLERTNIILIFCDDLGYGDLSCYGAPKIKTPHIDQLAAEGMRFTDFYVGSPLCSPSRAALLTGCYPRRIGLANWVLRPDSTQGLHQGEITLPQLLKTRGYTTACIGKWHLGFLPEFRPNRKGFDYYYGLWHNLDEWEAKFYADQGGVPVMRNETVALRPAKPELMTQLYTAETLKFIQTHTDGPFFLYLAHTMPHLPLGVSEKFKGHSAAGLYGDAIEELDWSVGQIIAALRAHKMDRKTIVLFTSDNGPALQAGGSAGPLRAGKNTTYEGGLREPFIAWAPAFIPAGQTCREVACSMDLYPTLARLAGATLPTDRVLDGRDILPLLRAAPGATSPHAAFFYHTGGGKLEAVRAGTWKLIVKANPELYDLSRDIGEQDNVITQHPEVAARLRRLYDQFENEISQTARPVGQGARPSS